MEAQIEVSIEVKTIRSSIDPIQISKFITAQIDSLLKVLEEKEHVGVIEEIQNIVFQFFPDVTNEHLHSASRDQIYVLPRQLVMTMLKKHTKLSLKFVGIHYGGRDHSTVIHALKSISDRYDSDKKFRTIYSLVDEKIEHLKNNPNESVSRYWLSDKINVQKIYGESKSFNEQV